MPIVYILTNQSMPESIKIRITENLERRIKKELKEKIANFKKAIK